MTPGLQVCYQGHVQNQGDTDVVCNGGRMGTTGQSLRLEEVSLWVHASPADPPDMKIWYSGLIQDHGLEAGGNGSWVGTNGESRRLEGLRVKNRESLRRQQLQSPTGLDAHRAAGDGQRSGG